MKNVQKPLQFKPFDLMRFRFPFDEDTGVVINGPDVVAKGFPDNITYRQNTVPQAVSSRIVNLLYFRIKRTIG